jgi:hypothetical protein
MQVGNCFHHVDRKSPLAKWAVITTLPELKFPASGGNSWDMQGAVVPDLLLTVIWSVFMNEHLGIAKGYVSEMNNLEASNQVISMDLIDSFFMFMNFTFP